MLMIMTRRDVKKYRQKQAQIALDYLFFTQDRVVIFAYDGYVVRGTGSLSNEKREQRRIRELEKAASNSQSFKTMCANQHLRVSQNPIPTDTSTISQSLEKKDSEETVKTYDSNQIK